MSKVYYERRDRTDRIIERVGPFPHLSAESRHAEQIQMRIAHLHNRSRYSDDPSRQLVWTVVDDRAIG